LFLLAQLIYKTQKLICEGNSFLNFTQVLIYILCALLTFPYSPFLFFLGIFKMKKKAPVFIKFASNNKNT